MSKPRIIGTRTTYIPNNRADALRKPRKREFTTKPVRRVKNETDKSG